MLILTRKPEQGIVIDGTIRVAEAFARPGALVTARVVDAIGPDLAAEAVRAGVAP